MRSSPPGTKSASIPSLQVGLRAHELAVSVEILARVRLPERVLPDVERLFEAVDVLGDPQLGDPALARRLAVALGVRRREVQLGGRAGLVGAKVDVVVGEHAVRLQPLRLERFNQAGRRSASRQYADPAAW